MAAIHFQVLLLLLLLFSRNLRFVSEAANFSLRLISMYHLIQHVCLFASGKKGVIERVVVKKTGRLRGREGLRVSACVCK